jgi:hypothetical protein
MKKRRSLIVRPLASLLVGTSLLLVGAHPAAASATRNDTPRVVTVDAAQTMADAQALKDGYERFNAEYAEDTSPEGAAAVAQVQADVAAGRIVVHVPSGSKISAHEVKVWVSKSGDRGVFLPYAGSVVRPSGLTVMFGTGTSPVAYFETVFQAVDKDSGTVTVWREGVLQEHTLVDASGSSTDSEPATTAPAASNPITIQSWWDRFVYCLQNEVTIPSWVITGVTIACAIICVFTAGTGCLACIWGAAAGYTAEIGYCIGRASS